MYDSDNTKGRVFWVLIFVILLLPIGSSFYEYLYTKDYDYLIEAQCDPLKEICFSRDCSIADECPPNNLSNYKEFYVRAYDFEKCSDNSCEIECAKGLIACTPVLCDEPAGDICTTLPI